MTPEDLEALQGFTSPDEIISHRYLIPYLIVSSLILLGVIAASIKVIYVTLIKDKLKQRLAPFDKALILLEKLKDSSPDTKTAALRTSYIFREMLEEKVGDKALFETNEEFTLRHDALNSLPYILRDDTRYYLQKLAHLKYVPKDSPETASQIIDEAITLIRNLIREIEIEEHRKSKPSSHTQS